MQSKLNMLRKKIDSIDSQLLKLLNERAQIAITVGKEKVKTNKNSHLHVPERERQIFKRLNEINTGPFPEKSIKAIFREIFSATLSLERPLNIAYLGPEATFTHMAGLKHFGYSANFIPLSNIKDVFSDVECGRSDYGVIPIENSIEGVVSHTLDLFVDSHLKICSEILLDISQNLLASHRNIKKIKKIYSHPQAFAQCRTWLENNFPNTTWHEVSSTSKAAQKTIKDPLSAAIASESAAVLYNLQVIEKSIEDTSFNVTRFLVIASEHSKKTDHDKTSILFSLQDKAGALINTLEPLLKHNINMTKIESRPQKKKAWKYLFFVDIEGHLEDDRLSKALKEVKKKCSHLKILGSYPKYKTDCR